MKSRIYVGTVAHARRGPVEHRFEYPVYVFALDLDELPELSARHAWLGVNRARPVSLWDRDYLDGAAIPLGARLRSILAERGVMDFSSLISVTMPRLLGHAFNPVSFHHAFRADGSLTAVIAEVNNTMGERCIYVLDDLVSDPHGWSTRMPVKKTMYVSPFYDVTGAYSFRFGPLGDRLDVRVTLERDGMPALIARISGQARPLNGASYLRTLMRMPLEGVLTVPRIAVQAARLAWQRRLPVVPKPEAGGPETWITSRPGLLDRVAQGFVLGALEALPAGALTIAFPAGDERSFGPSTDLRRAEGASARIDVLRPRLFRRLAADGDVALGEAYVDGDWSTPDLVRVLTTLLRGRDALERPRGVRGVAAVLAGMAASRRRAPRDQATNTPVGSRENIRRHYDLGNEFFRLFLDPTMTYSSARFPTTATGLERAQEHKMELTLAQTGLSHRPGSHLLELGSGWGGLALAAARSFDCRVTSLTLSREQLAFARARATEAGLADRVSFEYADYREAQGTYDAIVSVEMLEAVGHRFYETFFATLERLLKPGGRAVVQTILLADARYATYLERTDWIQKHVFPGGMVPALSALTHAMTRSSSLALERIETFGEDYARTLALWRARFMERRDEARALGYDEKFLRLWEYYLAYCETGFRERELTVGQLVFTKPGAA